MIRTSFFISLILVLGCAEGVKTFPTTGKVIYKADGKPFNGLKSNIAPSFMLLLPL